MSILDDFFGDSATAVKECLYCGGEDGELIVAISDADGPTHWTHPKCRSDASANRQLEVDAKLARDEQLARDEEDGIFD